MKKRTRITLWIVIAVLIVAGFVWWQLWQLGRGLRTFHAENTQDVLLSAMSAEVLAPNVGNRQQPAGSEPLLDQYRKNSELSHQRSLLVITWANSLLRVGQRAAGRVYQQWWKWHSRLRHATPDCPGGSSLVA